MRYRPRNVLNTNKVREIKTSLLQRTIKAKVSLARRNVPAVTRKNTSEKIALTRRKFAASARLRATSKSLAAKRNKNRKMTV